MNQFAPMIQRQPMKKSKRYIRMHISLGIITAPGLRILLWIPIRLIPMEANRLRELNRLRLFTADSF